MFFNFINRIKIAEEAIKLVPLTGITQGSVVADIGGGLGHMTEFLSYLVGPAGKVVTTEYDAGKQEEIRKRVKEKGLNNVEVLQGGETSSNLEPGKFDLILTRAVYHHFTHPVELNKSFLEALKPGGYFVVIDFEHKWFLGKPEGVSQNRGGHGIPKQILINEVTSAGFKHLKLIDSWSINKLYLALFQKP